MKSKQYKSHQSGDKLKEIVEEVIDYQSQESEEKYIPFDKYSDLVSRAIQLRDNDIRKIARERVERDISSLLIKEDKTKGVLISRIYEFVRELAGVEPEYVDRAYESVKEISEEDKLKMIKRYDVKQFKEKEELIKLNRQKIDLKRIVEEIIDCKEMKIEEDTSGVIIYKKRLKNWLYRLVTKEEYIARVYHNGNSPFRTRDPLWVWKIYDPNFLKIFEENIQKELKQLGITYSVIPKFEVDINKLANQQK